MSNSSVVHPNVWQHSGMDYGEPYAFMKIMSEYCITVKGSPARDVLQFSSEAPRHLVEDLICHFSCISLPRLITQQGRCKTNHNHPSCNLERPFNDVGLGIFGEPPTMATTPTKEHDTLPPSLAANCLVVRVVHRR